MRIEDTIKTDSLPVNSIAMCNRLIELMRKNDTNCLLGMDNWNDQDNWSVEAVLWLLNSQVYGQLATIDLCQIWSELNK